MKPFATLHTLILILALASCEPPISKRPLVFSQWPPKTAASAKQLTRSPAPGSLSPHKQRTLVVQIRSDQPVPLVLKGRPGVHGHTHQHQHQHQHAAHTHVSHGHVLPHPHTHAHLHAHTHLLHAPQHLRAGPRPLKLSGPVYLKPAVSAMRKPLKIKLNNSKPKLKPTFAYDKPFKYEKPTAVGFTELQSLPLSDTNANFITDHFAPIYTVPAPNLAALHDNQLHEDPTTTVYLPPTSPSTTQSTVRPQTYLPPTKGSTNTQYSVHEDETNDQTIRDPISGSQKLFAPDPDPSLPTTKIRPATESFSQPSNGKPLPADVQNNHLPAQPLVQIVGTQAAAPQAPLPEIYPIQYAQQTYIAPIPIYNPTYLVTQSNQLYSQHKQQLFKPSAAEQAIEAGYVNADLTQEVASNGQILQAAKDPHHNIHPVLDGAPQFAALIAAPALGEEQVYETAAFHLPNVASAGPEGGFVVSNYYGNAHDSSQLLQAYAEEEARRQQLETEQAALELQKQQQIHLEELKAQAQAQAQHQQQLHLEELKAQAQEQHLQQQHQQHQLQLLQLQHQQQQQQQLIEQTQSHAPVTQDPAAAAFEEHQRLVQHQLGSNTPLRIFVPDEETLPESQRLQKRSDDLKKGTVVDVDNQKDLFEVSTSVEVSGGSQATRK